MLTYPVGMITADEVVLGGIVANSYKTTQTSYLYTGSSYWTMTPSGMANDGVFSRTHVFVVDSNGYIYDYTGGADNKYYASISTPSLGVKGIFYSYASSSNVYYNSYCLKYRDDSTNEYVPCTHGTYGNTKGANSGSSVNGVYEGEASYIKGSSSKLIAYFTNTNTTVPLGIRPSIVLKSGTKPTQGDGTPGNPYIVE